MTPPKPQVDRAKLEVYAHISALKVMARQGLIAQGVHPISEESSAIETHGREIQDFIKDQENTIEQLQDALNKVRRLLADAINHSELKP